MQRDVIELEQQDSSRAPAESPKPGAVRESVSDELDATPAQPARPQQQRREPDQAAEEVRKLREENARYQKRVAEIEQSERYWQEQAQSGGRREQPEPRQQREEAEPAAPQSLDGEKLMEVLATRGTDGLQQVLKQSGVMTKAEIAKIIRETVQQSVSEHVQQVRQSLTTDAKILKQYPDLEDPKSELTQRTVQIMKDQREVDPESTKRPGTLLLAARAAAAELRQERGSGDRGEERRAEPRDDREAARRERIRMQDGDRNYRSESRDMDELSELTPMQQRIAQQMGISEDSYRAHVRPVRRVMGGSR